MKRPGPYPALLELKNRAVPGQRDTLGALADSWGRERCLLNQRRKPTVDVAAVAHEGCQRRDNKLVPCHFVPGFCPTRGSPEPE
jgi:hypothetical protein